MPPITPRPPAFVTAAASSGPDATFIPGREESGMQNWDWDWHWGGTGDGSHRLGAGTRRPTCQKDGMFNAKQLCYGSSDDRHGGYTIGL